MEIEVIYSKRRRRSVSARVIQGVMVVRAPERIDSKELEAAIGRLKKKFERESLRENLNKDAALYKIAGRLNKKYFEGKATFRSIEYVTNFTSMYGICDFREREIRISHEVARYPS